MIGKRKIQVKLQKIISLSPGNNYEQIGEIEISSHAQMQTYIAEAKRVQLQWAALGIAGRKKILENIYQEFIAQRQAIAQLTAKEIGMPITISMQVDIEFGLKYMRGYLDNAQQWLSPEIVFENGQEIHHMLFEPRGVVGVSIPWNYPFCNFIWGVIQPLIVGNTVVFKHSEECPLIAQLLGNIMKTSALPHGVFNQVFGDGSDMGEALMNADIDHIYFTGSTRVGKHLYEVAAKKFIPAMLELGGSAPGIIFEDAHFEKAIESVYLYRFINSGQTCDGLKRLIVHRSLFNNVIQGLQYAIASKKFGSPEDPQTFMGPLVAERQLLSVEAQVADAVKKGATIVCGGKRPAHLKGAYYEPTLLSDITFDMAVWREEVFGPVLPIVPFDTQEEAITLANDSQYGLGGYIYTNDPERAMVVARQLKTGNISINNANYVIAQDPFGGYKNSGIGREHGRQGLREFCNTKLIAIMK